ncbi:MAG TPA: hypothetical protein VMR77_02695 [Patescibacteria group bacterium]|jgi:hypothetical protein|nr:hypothetical protein [Patescibacteria group bacterium]
MFIPLSEVDTEYREGGEERNGFYFYQRDSHIPVVVKITRLPANFDGESNWHRHKFVEEFSVPLIGEIIIKEEKAGKIIEKRVSKAILSKDEWLVGIECSSTKRISILIEAKSGKRREQIVEFPLESMEGTLWHTVANPTGNMTTMVTLKRVARSILKKDPLVLQVDRESKVL